MVTRELQTLVAPAHVIVFGSSARGNWTEDSDNDLILMETGLSQDRNMDLQLLSLDLEKESELSNLWPRTCAGTCCGKMDASMLFEERKVIGSLYDSAGVRIDFPRIVPLFQARTNQIDELVAHFLFGTRIGSVRVEELTLPTRQLHSREQERRLAII